MRHAIPFDTHAYVKRLVAAGVPEAQAEVHARAWAGIALAKLATKDDVERRRLDLRTDAKDFELRLTLRFGAMLGAAVAIMVAAVKFL